MKTQPLVLNAVAVRRFRAGRRGNAAEEKRTPRDKVAPPLILDQNEDGPPAIQRKRIIAADGTVLREETVFRSEWDDPADTSARTKKGARFGARAIRGFRRVWTIDVLHRGSPNEITAAHVAAAERLVTDHQRREGAVVMRSGSGASELGAIDVRVQAGIHYEAAMAALTEQGRFVVLRVAILNWTIVKLAEKLKINRDRAHGRVQAALDDLREHYDAGKKRKPREAPLETVAEAETVADEGLPVERIGRWDRGGDRRKRQVEGVTQG